MKEKLVHLCIITIFASLFYLNSFGNFFVWNDWTLIVENFLIKDWRNLPEIFTSAFWKPLIAEPPQVYRPLALVTFMADFALWGLKPPGYHATNIALHTANALLVYGLFTYYVSPVAAMIGAVLFAVHPIHTEAVTYISSRGELLMAFFVLSGVLLFFRSARINSKSLYLLSLPLFFLALLSKETAAIFPLWLAVADVTAFPSAWSKSLRSRLLRHAGPLAVLALYFLFKRAFVGMSVSSYSPEEASFLQQPSMIIQAIPLYLGLLLYPLNLHFLHSLSPSNVLLSPSFLLGILLLVAVGGGLAYAIRYGGQTVIVSLSWLLVGFLPLLYHVRFVPYFFEAWIYLPSVGLFLLAAIGFGYIHGWSGSRVPFWLVLLIAVLLGGVTLRRNPHWKDNMHIALHTAQTSPDDPVALTLLANAYFQRGRTDRAEEIFQKALTLAPEDPRLYESVGELEIFLGKDPEALERFHRMRDLSPRDPYPHWRIGRFHLKRNNLAESEKYLAEAVRLFPYSSEMRNDLARVYYLQGRLDAAEREIRAALKILPRSPTLQENLQRVLERRQR